MPDAAPAHRDVEQCRKHAGQARKHEEERSSTTSFLRLSLVTA